ncbi:hypothetical protein [Fodinicola feengrottensis]|uniref:hypothetical protein n=1 Tax=Fodinicola feengrottensis TaxID=435914 RepID=UPI0024432267|nr:hypothetical protein [Fodinicola feengrottensis]
MDAYAVGPDFDVGVCRVVRGQGGWGEYVGGRAGGDDRATGQQNQLAGILRCQREACSELTTVMPSSTRSRSTSSNTACACPRSSDAVGSSSSSRLGC